MEQDCIFCKIVKGDISSEILYQDDKTIVIQDINPKAPIHLLVIAKTHISTLSDVTAEQTELAGHLLMVAINMARMRGIDSKGYRIVINCGQEGHQMVHHLHLHILGGRQLSGSMG